MVEKSMRLCRKACLLLAFFIPCALAAPPSTEAPARVDESATEPASAGVNADAYRHMLIERLAVGFSARDKLLAALLLQMDGWLDIAMAPMQAASGGTDQRRREKRVAALVREAARHGQDDALVQWTIANGEFNGTARELQKPAIDVMRRLQPDNLAVWLLTADPRTPMDAVLLRKAAAATHYDMSYSQRLAWIVDAHLANLPGEKWLAGVPDWPDPTPREYAIFHAVTTALAGNVPAFNTVSHSCKPDVFGYTAVIAEDCRRIAGILTENSDTLLAKRMGFYLAEMLAIDNPQRLEAVRQQRRNYDWQVDQYAEISQNLTEREMIEFLVDRIHTPGMTELIKMREKLQTEGISLTPPQGWRAPGEISLPTESALPSKTATGQ